MILILLLALAVFIVGIFIKRINVKIKLSYFVVGAYVALLIIGAVVYSFLPIVETPPHSQATELTDEMYDLIYNGEWEQLPEGVVEKTEWEFHYEGPYIDVENRDPEMNYLSIEVVRKEADDGLIEIVGIGTFDIYYENMLYKGQPARPSFELKNGVLNMHPPITIHETLVFLKNEWTVEQFNGGHSSSSFGSSSWGSSQFMYLQMKIPKSLEVRGDEDVIYGDLEIKGSGQE
ncbi:hypothetical protein [Alkalihalobacillus pseudalcaliphilus]|uniref:hypothetical protein n=1 Tax=Alkalihalobacillus pseudalcaliphilus TaxID=79884 RepID=UPI00064DD852|nr:hypothetical protein [Alkalihalobacillus pseudalcaliphilus]KMK75536.1 hypothetical protein AB990_09565 [Alkalihalobacillus pseudalcaliphilus]